MLVIPFLLFEAKEMCSSQELPSRYKELIHYSEESVNKYLKMGSIETAILCGLPIKCEHFNMYAFTLPLAQMSKQTKKKDGYV